MAFFDKDDPNAAEKIKAMFSPGQVDHHVRQAIQMCWMMLPANRKTVDDVEKEFRRIADRALKNLQEDSDSFRPPADSWTHRPMPGSETPRVEEEHEDTPGSS